MLNREEFNRTFGCDLSEEEFETIMGKGITDEDILNGRVDKLTFCDKQGHKQEFAKVVKGEWISHIEDDGYIECPFCQHATNCDSTEEQRELHYCFYCGAELK